MSLDLKKWGPWNWVKKEQEDHHAASSAPEQRGQLAPSAGAASPIAQLHREIDRWFDNAFRGFGLPAFPASSMLSDWPTLLKPALDIQETEKAYQISLEVPGVEEKDIQITLNNDVLTVRGQKRQEQEHKEGDFHRIERSYGSFQRVLNLPDNANQESIKATFKNGVLTIVMDKHEISASPAGRSIPIES